MWTSALRVILFDIDGTLLSTFGAGRRALAAALREVFGTAGPLADGLELAGKTDRQICREALALAGVDAATVTKLDIWYDAGHDGVASRSADSFPAAATTRTPWSSACAMADSTGRLASRGAPGDVPRERLMTSAPLLTA